MKLSAKERELFRAVGATGGKKRAANMTPEQRSASARKAALALGEKRRAAAEKRKKSPVLS